MSNLSVKHHYIPRAYLKAWTNKQGKIFVYNTLVPHGSFPVWQDRSLKTIAYKKHFHTLLIDGDESDEIEKWINREVETPAQEPLNKTRNGEHLSSTDLECLIRYIALLDFRTPARYFELMTRWHKIMPKLLNDILNEAIEEFSNNSKVDETKKKGNSRDADIIPLKLNKLVDEENNTTFLEARTLLGRSLWLYLIKYLMNKTEKKIPKHTWSIVSAPKNMEWVTSDNPVIKLNYYASGLFDFKGGWGNEGTEIIFPLSPSLLMYTQVGSNKHLDTISLDTARDFQYLIAKHSHRYIYAKQPINGIEKMKPRVIDEKEYKLEMDEWANWHAKQKEAEMKLMRQNDLNDDHKI